MMAAAWAGNLLRQCPETRPTLPKERNPNELRNELVQNKRAVLVIHEAENFELDRLEMVRPLSNIERDNEN
jgi:type II secretory pathway predicted ATPase ExeA